MVDGFGGAEVGSIVSKLKKMGVGRGSGKIGNKHNVKKGGEGRALGNPRGEENRMGKCGVYADVSEAGMQKVKDETKIGGGKAETVKFEDEGRVPDLVEGLLEVEKEETGGKREIKVIRDV